MKQIARPIVYIVGAYAILGLIGIIVLVYVKADMTSIAVVAGQTGPAIGILGAMMNRTEAHHEGPKGTTEDPVKTKVVNEGNDPVPITEEA